MPCARMISGLHEEYSCSMGVEFADVATVTAYDPVSTPSRGLHQAGVEVISAMEMVKAAQVDGVCRDQGVSRSSGVSVKTAGPEEALLDLLKTHDLRLTNQCLHIRRGKGTMAGLTER